MDARQKPLPVAIKRWEGCNIISKPRNRLFETNKKEIRNNFEPASFIKQMKNAVEETMKNINKLASASQGS